MASFFWIIHTGGRLIEVLQKTTRPESDKLKMSTEQPCFKDCIFALQHIMSVKLDTLPKTWAKIKAFHHHHPILANK